MPGRILDVSSNNHPSTQPIDWSAVAAAGFTTAFVKATQGTTYANPWFEIDMLAAGAAGLDVLAYHYAAWTTPAAEARYFQGRAGAFAAVLDGESGTATDWINRFFATLGRVGARGLYYGGAAALLAMRPAPAVQLWVADWTATPPSTLRAACVQFTSHAAVPGVPTLADESRWRGSQAAYDTLFGRAPAPDPPPEEETTVKLCIVEYQNGQWLVGVGGGVPLWRKAIATTPDVKVYEAAPFSAVPVVLSAAEMATIPLYGVQPALTVPHPAAGT